MSLVTVPNNSPSPRRESSGCELERLYEAALSDMEGLLDSKYGWTDEEAIRIDDMIVQFRIWGIELDINSGTLRLIQHNFLKEAAAIRVNLQAVRSSLTRVISHMSRELNVEVKVQTKTVNTVKSRLEDTRL